MADTLASAGLRVQQWDSKFYTEFLNENIFSDFQGTGSNSIVQVKEDLTKKQGDSVTYALVNRLTQDATTGSAVLEGQEEDMATRSFRVYVDKRRHAIRMSEMEEQKSAIPLREAARDQLMEWLMEDTRDRYIEALGSINGVAYASATENQKDAWVFDNRDRVLFGAAKSNLSGASYDHSAALATIDTSADRLTPNALSLMKRMARTANPKIRPIRTSGDNHYYLVLAGSNTFRDLKTHATITQALREVSLAAQNNRLFTQAGDIQWDNLLIREVPDLPVYVGVGSGGNVSPVYMLGAQALALAVARRAKTITKEFDYGDKQGIAVDQIDGIRKMIFGSGAADTDDTKDHGVLTGYFFDAADS